MHSSKITASASDMASFFVSYKYYSIIVVRARAEIADIMGSYCYGMEIQ